MRGELILTGLINIIIGIVEIFLGLRLILKLLGANPSADFVAWLYAVTEPVLGPFQGIFPSPVIEQGSVFEFSTLFAIFIYALIAWLLKEIIFYIAGASRGHHRKYKRVDVYDNDEEVVEEHHYRH